MADASLRGQVVLEILSIRERFLKGLIEHPAGFHPCCRSMGAVSVGIEGTGELPAFGVFQIWLNRYA
jgi:hypothetical protein